MEDARTFEKIQFLVSSDKTLLQVERIHRFLSTEAHWCRCIPRKVVEKAIEGSICFGLFRRRAEALEQVGFARVVTDHATFAWLCDVYVEEELRGQGLASWLMECVKAHPELQGLRRFCLATKDAHALYAQFGFEVTKTPGSWMEIKNNDIYRTDALTGVTPR